MKKFTSEEREMLSKAAPITRKWLYNFIINGGEINQKLNLFHYLQLVEQNIYREWHANAIADMKRIKLHDSLPDLFAFVATPAVGVAMALSKAQKCYASEKSKTRQKQIGKMIAILTRLAQSEKKLYREATTQLLIGQIENTLESIAKKLENADASYHEYRLYTKQSIKHYNRLVKLGITPSIHELYQCLDVRFAAEDDIFNKQVAIVYGTYTGQDVDAPIKDTCFNFIKQSIGVAGYLHANLIDYIFKGDEISERAFQLFCDTADILRKTGMAVLPHQYAHRLAVKKGLYAKSSAELSDGDIRILRLERMFQ
jgi:hypothetical protein